MQQYIYSSKHLPALKKYGIMKMLFLFLGCLILLLQSITWLIVWVRDMYISTTDMVFVGLTLASAFYFIVSQSYFLVRNNRIMKTIKKDGSFTSMRVKLRFSNKHSWAGGFVVFCRFLVVLFVILLGIMIVNFVQDYLNWGKVILKMPFMVFCAISILNLSAEMRYQTILENINK